LGAAVLPGHNLLVKWLLWASSNLVKAIIHQTTVRVASFVTIFSVNPSFQFSQGAKRIFSSSLGGFGAKIGLDLNPYYFSRHFAVLC